MTARRKRTSINVNEQRQLDELEKPPKRKKTKRTGVTYWPPYGPPKKTGK